MSPAHSPEIHARLLARIPVVTGQDLHEWFDHLESGPALSRCSERSTWLADEHGISNGYAQAIVHEYDRRRRNRSPLVPRQRA
ncbi:DUF4287 domain-containing protein [Spiractinospora alimapuensis]|uniref:DUF4287 domain-containing protein n=1 Tax=Spiractinospora alimapuensis TaxID=2820884 RepID=UPI001F39A4F9|nr:DUF4287 domain-containing protein [Spiractinospora alimapuensis]QVQ51427.1 DUF4287 domain-containing protein [Spiractinospora alimapuensis]